LEGYDKCSEGARKERLAEALFLRTWSLSRGKGEPTTTPLTSKYARANHLWWGKIPMESISKYILILDVGLEATGKLDHITLRLASKIKIPHTSNQGAGGENDFKPTDAFQKQIKKTNLQRKEK
jgi:hypothetical protein